MITLGIILLVFFISKGIRDRIMFRPDDFYFIKNKKIQDWVLGRNDYDYDKRTWLTKYIFSFFGNGWHFFDSLTVVSFCIALSLLAELPLWSFAALYYAGGVIFEMVYNIKIR